MLNLHHLGLASILILCATAALSQIIDNFEVLHFNNLGGMRYGIGNVQTNVTYPRHGIVIPGKEDYLMEELVFRLGNSFLDLDYSLMYLKIDYTSFQSGRCPIVLIYRYHTINGTTYSINEYKSGITVYYEEDQHQIIVPLKRFSLGTYYGPYTSKLQFLAFGIGGPLIVHRLDLIDRGDVTIPVSSVKKIDDFSVDLSYHPTRIQRKPSPLQHQFEEYDQFLNQNSIGLRRGGFGISKLPNGVSISNGGVLFENVPAGTNFEHHKLKLKLTWQDSYKIRVNVQYHHGTGMAGLDSSSSIWLEVPQSTEETVEISFTRFRNIRFQDVKRIWISGPVTIHSIAVVDRITLYQLFNAKPDLGTTVTVDNFESWPSNLATANMVIDMPLDDAKLFKLNSNTPWSGLNSFNYRCIGDGVSIADGGIQLSTDGSIFEQLALPHHFYDLNNVRLEIVYSAEHVIDRTLKICTVIQNNADNHFHIEPVKFDLHFDPGKHSTVMIDVGNCGPSNAFHITGQGAVTLHRIELHMWANGHQTSLNTLVIDDFSDWPLMTKSSPIVMVDPINSDTPTNNELIALAMNSKIEWVPSGGHSSTVIDYRYINWHQKPFLDDDCQYVPGYGVKIDAGGRLIQPFAGHVPSTMIIIYSTSNSATQEIEFIATCKSRYIISVPVVFHSGQFQCVVIRIVDPEYCLAVIINGKINVHQLQLVE